MQLRLKEDHPDVRIAKNRIAELEKKAEAEALQQPLSDGRPAGAADRRLTPTGMRRLSSLRAEFESLDRGIKLEAAPRPRTRRPPSPSYQRRVETAPMLESQLSGLMRDYEHAQGHLRRPAAEDTGRQAVGQPRTAAGRASSSASSIRRAGPSGRTAPTACG